MICYKEQLSRFVTWCGDSHLIFTLKSKRLMRILEGQRKRWIQFLFWEKRLRWQTKHTAEFSRNTDSNATLVVYENDFTSGWTNSELLFCVLFVGVALSKAETLRKSISMENTFAVHNRFYCMLLDNSNLWHHRFSISSCVFNPTLPS